MDVEIDYNLLGICSKYYNSLKYEYVNVPWIVPMEDIMVTCPSNDMVYTTQGGGLVGSAEQSFIHLLRNNKLSSDRKYYAITPCFRLGDSSNGPLHKEYFIKLELFSISYSFLDMIEDAKTVFNAYGSADVTRKDFDNSSDLFINGIEVGSYGSRVFNGIQFNYGTGLALPRFSEACILSK